MQVISLNNKYKSAELSNVAKLIRTLVKILEHNPWGSWFQGGMDEDHIAQEFDLPRAWLKDHSKYGVEYCHSLG